MLCVHYHNSKNKTKQNRTSALSQSDLNFKAQHHQTMYVNVGKLIFFLLTLISSSISGNNYTDLKGVL